MAEIRDTRAEYVNCTACHLDPAPESAALDYSDYFLGGSHQHSVGVDYRLSEGDYQAPTAVDGDITFFDTNADGLSDSDEVQLFGASNKVECSSCHREHGEAPAPASPNMYLRIPNTGDALCRTCHRL